MPSLSKVCVWEIPFPVTFDTTNSPNVYFTNDCLANSLDVYEENGNIVVYPNPADDIINIEIANINYTVIEIYNISGKLIYNKGFNSKSEKIDISGFQRGIYLVKVKQGMLVFVEKVVVR
jgi:hypothetical protein